MKKWTEEEVEFLNKYYPNNGSMFCAKELSRTCNSISSKVSKLKIKENNENFIMRRVGEKYTTNEGYNIEIIEYFSSDNCTVKFLDGIELKNIQYNRILLGTISNPYHKSVFDVGYFGVGTYLSRINKIKTNSYTTWVNILRRCYSEKERGKYPTYKNITVCEEWHNFQNFAQWFEENYKEGFQLDKDIICPDCKVYSPETCEFIPQEINKLFTKRGSKRGKYPIGVCFDKNKFKATISIHGINKNLGVFNTSEEAFQAYKVAKELWIREVADKHRKQITEQCYQAMYNYKVEITD